MKTLYFFALAVLSLQALGLQAEDAAKKDEAKSSNHQNVELTFPFEIDGQKQRLRVTAEPEDLSKLPSKGFWIPFLGGHRKGEFHHQWFVFPLLCSGSFNNRTGSYAFSSPLYECIKKDFFLKVDRSKEGETDMVAVFDENPEDNNARFALRSCPVLLSFHFLVEGEEQRYSVFAALPLLTINAATADSNVFASVPLMTYCISDKETEKASTLFGLVFEYEKGLKTEETSVVKGALYSSDFDGVMDKRKVGPFGILYSSTAKEGTRKHSALWDMIFRSEDGPGVDELELGPLGILFSHSASAGDVEKTSLLSSFIYESRYNSSNDTLTRSYTPLFGTKTVNGRTTLRIPIVDRLLLSW